jgi:ABC-type transport system involved in multi-copper enzyme maturation permease subunit
MKTSKRLSPVVRIAKHTIRDEIRQRSFIAMLVVCLAFILLLRGCYQGNYTVNGQVLDSATIAGTVSKAAFHMTAAVAMVVAALLSMRIFRRDRDEGTQSSILSKPVTRRQYVLAKLFGVWALASAFMLVLQIVVFLIAVVTAGVVLPGYLAASLLYCCNLLFAVVAVLLFSLLMPEIMAFLSVIGIAVVSLLTDGINALSGNQVSQAVIAESGGQPANDLSLSKILYYLWPKLSGMQHFASSFISGDGLRQFWSIFPFFNVLIYCLILTVLLLRRFGKEEIA